jgi:hypothetical protein
MKVPMVGKKLIQTAQNRLAALEQVADDFSRHLETIPGTALGPDLRLAIAQCARDALSCQECAISQQVCNPKNANLYEIYSLMKHDKPIPVSSSVDQKVAATVTSIVHGIVNHQSKLNHQWYESCVKEIKACGLIDATRYSNADMAVTLACYSALSEIILLTAMSHSIQVLYLALDKELPKLPTKAAPGPSYIDFSLLLHRWHHDPDKMSSSLYYLWPDVNTKSPEFLKLSQSTRESLPKILSPMAPIAGVYFAPEDVIMCEQRFLKVLYLGTNVVRRRCNDMCSFSMDYPSLHMLTLCSRHIFLYFRRMCCCPSKN